MKLHTLLAIALLPLSLKAQIPADPAAEAAAKQRTLEGLTETTPRFRTRGAPPAPASEVRSGYVPRGVRPVLSNPAVKTSVRPTLQKPGAPDPKVNNPTKPDAVPDFDSIDVKVNPTLKASFDDVLFIKNTAKFADDATTAKVHGMAAGLLELLKAHPDQRYLIEGHTCDLGEDDYNARLSWLRAEAVRLTLIGRGVPAKNLQSLGCGEREAKALESLPKDLEDPRKPYRKVMLRALLD